MKNGHDDFILGPALLFCPANRPDRYAKAYDRSDAVILDLEDAIDPADRADARGHLRQNPLDPDRVIVRINPVGSADFAQDLQAVHDSSYRRIMLPKTSGPEDVTEVARREPTLSIIALCESAAGVVHSAEIASKPSVTALMWGAEDLIASMGGRSSRNHNGGYRDAVRYARSQVLLSASAAGKACIDTVHLGIADHESLATEARDAAASGFAASACIHPDQVPVIRSAYAPTESEREYASELLVAVRQNNGVFRFRGTMVDAPMIAHARRISDKS